MPETFSISINPRKSSSSIPVNNDPSAPHSRSALTRMPNAARDAAVLNTQALRHPAIARDEIILVVKASRLELDARAQGLNHMQLREWYNSQGLDADRIFLSHDRQQEALRQARAELLPSAILTRYEFTTNALMRAKVVIALGGDNHFCHVARRLTNQKIIGINSDPLTSEGALTRFRATDLAQLLQNLSCGNYHIEAWTRIDVQVGNRSLGCALNDVFLGERERQYMSRHLLRWNGTIEEQKGSGLLVSTGSNSLGWYRSASRYLHPDGAPFDRTQPILRFLLTEPYCGKTSCASQLEGDLGPGETLEVTSFNDADGVVTIDSELSAPFPRGERCTLKVSADPLQVITP